MSDLVRRYVKKAAIESFFANLILNGIIAWLMYRLEATVLRAQMAADIPITVFLVALAVALIVTATQRKTIQTGQAPATDWRRSDHALLGRLPRGNLGRSTLFALALSVVFGGLVLVGSLGLLGIGEMTNWGYIVFKALYTGVTGAITTAVMAICALGDETGFPASQRRPGDKSLDD